MSLADKELLEELGLSYQEAADLLEEKTSKQAIQNGISRQKLYFTAERLQAMYESCEEDSVGREVRTKIRRAIAQRFGWAVVPLQGVSDFPLESWHEVWIIVPKSDGVVEAIKKIRGAIDNGDYEKGVLSICVLIPPAVFTPLFANTLADACQFGTDNNTFERLVVTKYPPAAYSQGLLIGFSEKNSTSAAYGYVIIEQGYIPINSSLLSSMLEQENGLGQLQPAKKRKFELEIEPEVNTLKRVTTQRAHGVTPVPSAGTGPNAEETEFTIEFEESDAGKYTIVIVKLSYGWSFYLTTNRIGSNVNQIYLLGRKDNKVQPIHTFLVDDFIKGLGNDYYTESIPWMIPDAEPRAVLNANDVELKFEEVQ